MGSTPSGDTTTAMIDSKLREADRKQQKVKKMLFLGPGGSGKTTILKQLQWLHLDGFTKQAALNLKHYIYTQTVNQMRNVIEFYESREEKRDYGDDVELQNAIATVKGYAHQYGSTLDDSLADAIKYIWNHDEKIKNVFTDYEVFTFNKLDETTQHFWNALDRIKAPDYVPNEADILNVRCKTTGAVQKEFAIENTIFTVYDVGGQKSERRKWLHFFNEVHVVLFVVSLSCYDQMMYQNVTKNCMVDSLELFDEIVNNKCFESTHVILFLNKKDLFEKKIVALPITVCPAFSDYDQDADPSDFDQTTTYIARKFHALNKNTRKKIFTHLTYAMDRKNIDRVFIDIHCVVISNNLSSSGALI